MAKPHPLWGIADGVWGDNPLSEAHKTKLYFIYSRNEVPRVNTFFNIDSILALGKWNLADIGTKMYSHNGSVIYQVWHILEIFALSMDWTTSD